MWHRRTLKAQARANLKGIFIVSGLVTLIVLFLNLEYIEAITDYLLAENAQAAPVDSPAAKGLFSYYPIEELMYMAYLHLPFQLLFSVIGAGAGLVAILVKMFVGSPVLVGEARYFLTVSRNRERVDWRILFSVFREPYYLNLVKVRLITDVKIMLWSLLLLIPGLVKAYEYKFITWILAENPGMDQKTAQKISSDLTRGHKADMFILDLSMLGWDLLMLVTLGLALPFVVAYRTATHTELYDTLKSQYTADGDVHGIA